MFEEEHPTRGLKSLTESYILIQIGAMGIATSWLLGGVISWLLGYTAVTGFLTFIFIEAHRRHGFFETTHLYRRFFLAITPAWLTLLVFAGGISLSPFTTISLGDYSLLSKREIAWWLPTTSNPEAWLSMLFFIAVYIASMGITFMALSTSLLRRLLLILSINAVVLAIVGYVQLFSDAEGIFWYFKPVLSFFASFTHASHYASFALLWSLVYLAFVLHYKRQQTIDGLLSRRGLSLLVGFGILASSVIVSGTLLHQGLLLTGIGWCLITEVSAPSQNGRKVGALLTGLLAVVLIIAGIGYPAYAWIDTGQVEGLSWDVQKQLWSNAWAFFLERPLFGWGIGSYPLVSAMHADANLTSLPVLSPHSDLLSLLVEQGIAGFVMWATPVIVLAIRFLRQPSKRLLSAQLWIVICIMSFLALVSFPMQNPASLLSFWVILGIADAWMKVQQPDVLPQARIFFNKEEIARVQKLEKPKGSTHSRIESKS